MSVVYKYGPLAIGDVTSVVMPQGAQVLHVAPQGRFEPSPIHLWARVDPQAPVETRRFRLAGTGHQLDDATVGDHIGTWLQLEGALVLHLFELKENGR